MDNAFEKGVRLMETLARSDRPKGVTELAQALALTKSNVHRLLRSLVTLGYAHQDVDSDRYEATIKFWELGFKVISRSNVRSFALPHMQHLGEVTREQVNLAVLDNDEIVYIDKIESTQPVHAPIGIGHRSPAYNVALGKAMLAYQSPQYVERALGNLHHHAGGAIKTADALASELARVRKVGYATNRGEWRVGVTGLAAPIFGSGEHAVAAIGISGPSERLRPRELARHAPRVIAAAHAISEALSDGSAAGRRKPTG